MASNAHPARTVLEQQIRQRRQTFEEFAEYAETFAREHGEPGTLSARHVQRLAAGQGADGRPLGPVRPATRRLLEAIFAIGIDELLSPPATTASPDTETWEQGARELQEALSAAGRVDNGTVELLSRQLDLTRQLDRRLGAATLLASLREQARMIEHLVKHCTTGNLRGQLAVVLTDACTLAGWQSTDRGELSHAWHHYETAVAAAREAASPALEAHALAEQAVVLADIGETRRAAELTDHSQKLGQAGSRLVRSWLAAAHGEALAANNQRSSSLRAFDEAATLLPDNVPASRSPYVALDVTHLTRWRGNALTRFGHPDALAVLTDALDRHDLAFVRAETTLRVDLALAYLAIGEPAAANPHRERAAMLARTIGSKRQKRRLVAL